MDIRDRVKELRKVPARELRPSALNWRKHPAAQQDALRGVLSEIGYAGALLAYEEHDGGLRLIDGHLRAETTPDMDVPVLVLDVDEREAKYMLATHDPLGAMAEKDDAILAGLLQDVSSGSQAVQEMLAGLYAMPDIVGGGAGDSAPGMSLVEKFGVPPFSVLDARQGYWQDRKRAWLALGIQSELGRGDVMPSGGGSCYSGSSEWSGKRGGRQKQGVQEPKEIVGRRQEEARARHATTRTRSAATDGGGQ
jgi:hypothetical protein